MLACRAAALDALRLWLPAPAAGGPNGVAPADAPGWAAAAEPSPSSPISMSKTPLSANLAALCSSNTLMLGSAFDTTLRRSGLPHDAATCASACAPGAPGLPTAMLLQSSAKAQRPCISSTSSESENCVPECHDAALSALVSLLPKMSRRVRFGGDTSGMLYSANLFLAAILASRGRAPRPLGSQNGVV